MKAYIFQAALWCETCTAPIELRQQSKLPPHANIDDDRTYDSDVFPKGPYSNGGGEADSPQHCEGCGAFLKNPLTPDGVAYVIAEARRRIAPPGTRALGWREAVELADGENMKPLADWLDFYELDITP